MKNLTNEELIKALDDKIAIVRNSAVQELGKRKVKAALQKIAYLLEHDENPLVRDNAAFALAEINEPDAIPYLIKALKDSDSWVRKSAVKALGILKAKIAFDDVAQLINDPSQNVRKAVARTLSQIDPIKAETYLQKLSEDPSIIVKRKAQEALKRIKG
jgi:HEAT repeat protein